MKILGLHYSPNNNIHDVAASLIIDGKVCGNYEEERFNRIKHACGKFPSLAIKKLIEHNKLSINDIDIIACNPIYKSLVISNLKSIFSNCKSNFEFIYDDHHNNHIYNAYCQSHFCGSTAAVIVVDGDGDQDDSITIAKIENNNISIIKKFNTYQSLGNMYEFCTTFCGLGDFGEGKLMGLAPFGNSSDELLLDWKNDNIYIPNAISYVLKCMNKINYSHSEFKKTYIKYLASKYYPYKKLDFNDEIIYYKDLAATVQKTFNYIMLKLVQYAKDNTNANNLILCGGCIQNCTANNLIVESNIFENVYAAPNSHDAGIALGSAIYALSRTLDKLDLSTYDDKYYNIEYSINNISMHLHEKIEITDISQNQIVKDLIDNKIIGWFQGGSEIGHRALCHRSIIANPMDRRNLNTINKYIKNRELFRPLAPTIPEELFTIVFDVSSTDLTEYMLRNIEIKKDIRKKMLAVCHIDNTTRPQLLKKNVNPEIYNLIMAFYYKTGIPGIINTSFNRIQEPIVETIDDAINMLLSIDYLDYIVFNTNIKISKKTV